MSILESGVRLGRYELLIELGRGGMASVWVARETSQASGQQRLVALKVMLPKLATDSTFRSMFLAEGQIVRAIEHPNVVRIFEVAETAGVLFMAMEWVEGDSLQLVIAAAKERRAIPPEMAVRIIADTAAGLHAAHELRGWDGELRGIVHCDVSPHNILIGPAGTAKLVDFGVAHAATQSDIDDGEQIRGKFGYMSPEQAQGRQLDRRADVFALGIVLYELTTGERLFRGRDPTHTLKLVVHGRIPPPSTLVPEYPAALEAIVLRALDRDLTGRFQTADELRAALEAYLVEAAILVSHAGVGGLVKRVLGGRVQQRREAIRAALARLGAGSSAAEVPLSEPHATKSPPSGASSVSPREGLEVLPSSEEGHAVSHRGRAARRRAKVGYAAAAVFLLASGAGATYFIVQAGAASSGVGATVTAMEPGPALRTSRAVAAPRSADESGAGDAQTIDTQAIDAQAIAALPRLAVTAPPVPVLGRGPRRAPPSTGVAPSAGAAPAAPASAPPDTSEPAPPTEDPPGFIPATVPPVAAPLDIPAPDVPDLSARGQTGPR